MKNACWSVICAMAAVLAVQGQSQELLNASASSSREKVMPQRFMKPLPLDFEQTSAGEFLARGPGYAVELNGSNAYVVAMRGRSKPEAVRVRLAGAKRANPAGEARLQATSNYFLGNDPGRWRTGVPHFAKVAYRGIYPGIDLIYYGSSKLLEHDFVVSAGANPDKIAFEVSGAKQLEVNGAGDLEIRLAGNDSRMALQKPVAYQEKNGQREKVECSYRIERHDRVRFQLGNYDRRRELVIDPVLNYSTYLGGSSDDFATAVAVDGGGNAYITGYTLSSDFPLKNAIQGTCGNSCKSFDVFVTKLNAAGTALIYSTFLGGSGNDSAYGIAVDKNGAAYITGYTNSSTDFPLVNAAQKFGGGNYDAFVAAINPQGTSLIYSTYLGGTGDEGFAFGNQFSEGPDSIPRAAGIAVDGNSNAYVIGNTDSTDFPVSTNAYQKTNGGSIDGYLVKYDSTGKVQFATYLGGSDDDVPRGVTYVQPGFVAVVGNTRSTNFPTTAGVLQTMCGTDGKCNPNFLGYPQSDAFVMKFNYLGSLQFSTFLGGSGADRATGVAADSGGNLYISGTTSSLDFPVLGGVQGTCNGCNFGLKDAFISKLNGNGTKLIYSTYYGGSGDNEATGIGVDGLGQAYISGFTTAPDFPTTPNAFQTIGGGGIFGLSTTGVFTPNNRGLKSSIITHIVGDSSGAYARGPNGLYKSTDAATWSVLANALVGVDAMALDPSNPGTLYVTIPFNDQVGKTTDGGTTWTKSGTGLPGAFDMPAIAVDPFNPKNVLVGTNLGIYGSTDGGSTFTNFSTGLPSSTSGNTANHIIFDPVTPGTAFASLFSQFTVSNGVYKTTDGGAHWSAANTGLTNLQVESLAIDPTNHLTLYAGTPLAFGGSAGIYKTTDGGKTWSLILDSAGAADISSLAVDGAGWAYAGLSGSPQRGGILGSTDGGVHWTDLGLDGGKVVSIYPLGGKYAAWALLAGMSDEFTDYDINGDPDEFVAEFDPAGATTLFSSYSGGTNSEQASGIAVDGAGDFFFVGANNGGGFPTTPGAAQTDPKNNKPTETLTLTGGGGNNTATVGNGEPPKADVAISKVTVPPATLPIEIGDKVVFKLKVANNGPDDDVDVEVDDQIPVEFDFTSFAVDSSLSTCGFDPAHDYDPKTGKLKFTESLAKGDSCTLFFSVTAAVRGNPINTATVKITDPGVVDPNLNNNQDSAGVEIVNKGVVTNFGVKPQVSSVIKGTAMTFTVSALDPDGHVVPGYTGTINLSSSDSAATFPSSYTFTSNDQGVHTFTVTFNTTGNQTLTATATQAIAGTSITPTGTSTDVTVTGSATSGISITPPKNPYGFKAPAGGQQIVLNFTVMPSGATGTVTVVDNTTGDVVGTGTVSSGTATVPIQRLGVGQHDLTAQYSGDGTYRAATTDTQVNQSPAPEIKGNPPPK